MAAKAITYIEIGQNGFAHSTYYSATGSVIDDAWTEILADGSFTVGSDIILVRGARRWDTPRMKGDVCLGNIGNATYDAQYGNMETQPGVIFTDVLNLDADAYRTVETEAIEITVDETTEPAEPQIEFTIGTLDGGPLTISAYGAIINIIGTNTSGGSRTLEGAVYLNGVEIATSSGAIGDDKGFYVTPFIFNEDLHPGDVIGIALWVDDESVVLSGQSIVTVGKSFMHSGGDMQLAGTATIDPDLDVDQSFSYAVPMLLSDALINYESASPVNPGAANTTEVARLGQTLTSDATTSLDITATATLDPEVLGLEVFGKARIWTYR